MAIKHQLFFLLTTVAVSFILVQSHPTRTTTVTPIICTTPACPWPKCTLDEASNTYTCTTDQRYLGCKCDPYVCTTPEKCPDIDIKCGPLNETNPPYCGCPSCYFPPPTPPPPKSKSTEEY